MAAKIFASPVRANQPPSSHVSPLAHCSRILATS
jgi:hypothetical protein